MQEPDAAGSSLKFGTSGLRGLVVDLLGAPTRAWTAAFLAHLERTGSTERLLLVGRDLRASSPDIAADCAAAALARGWRVGDCGALPTPALALAALERGAAAVMVTGSHIPDDRNGLKFYAPGEITKADEPAIRAEFARGARPAGAGGGQARDLADAVLSAYRRRYLETFPSDALGGLSVGVYQQSSVARDLLVDVLRGLGAQAVPLARAERFIPVDTEAHRPEDIALLREWAGEGRFDALVSTDGDADRPLVADATGAVLRGDLLGLLSAAYLGLETVVTPVTSSAAVERSGIAARVVRTKVGSPFVIEAMERAAAEGAVGILGFEANGGVLLGSDVPLSGGTLSALPTRDALLPILCALASARQEGRSLREMADRLGAGHALSDRLKEVPAEASGPFLRRLARDDAFAAAFMMEAGPIAHKDDLDGVRFRLEEGSVVHFRASGNAPELRCYVEAPGLHRAEELLRWGLIAAGRQMREG
ncbi:phosphomannomutase [Aureimonas populi]|uniref:Phosphomannomutase n=1 Tax=Aureimonas populi TaxID=1701758 RepID=A0ABW5CMK4_9HYPH|nr:phosphomannomutase [Aureimonas populi]